MALISRPICIFKISDARTFQSYLWPLHFDKILFVEWPQERPKTHQRRQIRPLKDEGNARPPISGSGPPIRP